MQFQIATALKVYLLLWLSALMLSFFLVIYNRKECTLVQKSYWKFLLERWKLFTLVVATLSVTLAAPYSGDPTWDVPDSIIISLLTYIFAPWSVAVLFRNLRSWKFGPDFWVALCVFFIPCWTYDLYILFRDKIYPPTWYNNLYISGGITLIAGLFWNLYYRDTYGLTFAFKLEEWPLVGRTPFKKVFWPCFFLCIPVVASIIWFVYMYIKN
ncbi:MAG: hypothetical protein GY797_20020 [Deltaproteobacteria bacterium]|nr:hypothetical protein [Deltaproteobacteria bacterium]